MATENALVVKYHVINHHHISQDNLVDLYLHNLSFVSFRWWRFMYFGYVRENNKQGNINCIVYENIMLKYESQHCS